LPALQRINAAAEALLSLESRLDVIGQTAPVSETEAAPLTEFMRIALNSVRFRYDDGEVNFELGPIDLEIRRGRVIFVTGGPTGGSLQVDDQLIEPKSVTAYRNLFAAIFSDNHLFKELYGTPPIDPAEISELLELMEMVHKVHIEGRAFSALALSSGQRKRLAMIALLLEHRPICVFDEWAADQEPHFRP
jgi:putative ATP-binding cassette transporter